MPALTEREKETLRLLLAGHDAKSIARAQGLSVHTVNERLRDARRKLDVPSSREAARLLAEADGGGPDRVGDKGLGVAPGPVVPSEAATDRRRAGRPLAWFAGGMVVMSLAVAALLALAPGGVATPVLQAAPVATTATDPAGLRAARDWVALLDARRWNDSWRAAAAPFKAQLTAAGWAATVEPVRRPLGAVVARAVQSVTATDTLPGAPAGRYLVVEFRTDFAGRSGAVETVVLSREAGGWKAAGYFIR